MTAPEPAKTEEHVRIKGDMIWLSGEFIAGMLAIENAQATYDAAMKTVKPNDPKFKAKK